MDVTDSEVEAIKVPVVSGKTAFSCLERVCRSGGERVKNTVIAAGDVEETVLPVDRLIAIAENSGLQVRAAKLDWRALLIATASKTILLLLRNGNVVAVLGTGRDGVEEIVVSDPLYQDGDAFFLPRVALEHAWGGDALIVKPQRSKPERALAWYFSILSVCGLAAGLLLLFHAAIEVTVAGSNAPRGEELGAASANQSSGGATPIEAQPSGAVTDAEIQSRADSGADIPSVAASPEAGRAASVAQAPQTEQPAAEAQRGADASAADANANARKTISAVEEDIARPLVSPAGAAPAAKTGATPVNTSTPRLSADDIAALLARGDSLIAKGDVASARLFYERAADAADGQAALRLGESYDPAFLARAHLSGIRGDAAAAARWYRRARELGAIEAGAPLQALAPNKD